MYLFAMHWERNAVYYAVTNITIITAVHIMENTRDV